MPEPTAKANTDSAIIAIKANGFLPSPPPRGAWTKAVILSFSINVSGDTTSPSFITTISFFNTSGIGKSSIISWAIRSFSIS